MKIIRNCVFLIARRCAIGPHGGDVIISAVAVNQMTRFITLCLDIVVVVVVPAVAVVGKVRLKASFCDFL